MGKFELLFHTLRYLRLKQILWRLVYASMNRIHVKKSLKISNTVPQIAHFNPFVPFLPNSPSYFPGNTFIFINLQYQFAIEPNWNFSDHGRLWTYNLNYFDFLLQSGIDKETGLSLIKNYCNNIDTIKDGLEPYPVSLRCINWIKFMITHHIQDKDIDKYLWAQVKHLNSNLEYHLMGNHLIENALALTIASLYFDDKTLRKKAEKLLYRELEEQILDDGAHFELSPMYHQIILGRLLDCINIARAKDETSKISEKLESITSNMIGWLNTVSFQDGSIPLVNDSAIGIAPNTKDLQDYTNKLNIKPKHIKLSKSGYRKFFNQLYECFLDVGNIGPDYQPGHAHADTFSFVLYHKGKPFIVDTGTSTYEPGERRSTERSTASHNTIVVGKNNSSEIWASHRVGKRAKVKIISESEKSVLAEHDGYKSQGVIHKREFISNPENLVIHDHVITTDKKINKSNAYLHFAPDFVPVVKGSIVHFKGGIDIWFEGANEIRKYEYPYAPEFNKTIPSQKLEIIFSGQLTTKIRFENTVSY